MRPITIPLAFIPFKVDGKDLGTLSRLQILRSSPKQVEAVNFRVKLADSIGDERLSQCILVAGDNGMNFQVKHIDAERDLLLRHGEGHGREEPRPARQHRDPARQHVRAALRRRRAEELRR